MEAPYVTLLFLLLTGFVSGQRSRSRILRERLYLETLANQIEMTNTTALNALVTKPLESTTTPPTPLTEGMDYEGSGFLDVFWKLTARAVTPSTAALPTTPGTSTPSSTTTSSPRPFTTSSETGFDQYDGYYYDVTSSSTTRRDTTTSTTRRPTVKTTTLPPVTRRTTSRPTTVKPTTRKTTVRTITTATPRPSPVTSRARTTSPVAPPSTTPRPATTTPRVTTRRTTRRATVYMTSTTRRPSTTMITTTAQMTTTPSMTTLRMTTTPSTTTVRMTMTSIPSTAAYSTIISSTDFSTARIAQTTVVPRGLNTTFPPTTPFTTTDDAHTGNVTLKQNETNMGNATSDDGRVAEVIDIIAFKTFQMLFGEDNNTAGGSDNEADGVAYGSTLYASGEIDWQTRIRTWFRTEFIGKLNF